MKDFVKRLFAFSSSSEVIEDISVVNASASLLTKGGGGDNLDDPGQPRPMTYSD